MPADHRHGITHRHTQDQRPNPGTEGALAADDHARVVEGTWPYDWIVLIEFAGQQDLDAWAASGDYQRIAADRRAGSSGVVLTIRGLDDPAGGRTTR